ncbi:LOW QUALITY PROTEIN: uncharacterized protein LOC130597708 [Pezoporus wallicus]|uniref:LOW QUALITY PROTEIN: uncharacterized protein LOC130597708 n=1 Tax=Pezoporus wallicus TaxID=35540 RepID=UPI00254D5729|nr:LOW QUALITY PROTEIN: uncharacterized protein LOC130597708 [Pezoporus wallicus]
MCLKLRKREEDRIEDYVSPRFATQNLQDPINPASAASPPDSDEEEGMNSNDNSRKVFKGPPIAARVRSKTGPVTQAPLKGNNGTGGTNQNKRQTTEDIIRKLQKLSIPDSRNIEKLVDEAWKVYRHREQIEEKKKIHENLPETEEEVFNQVYPGANEGSEDSGAAAAHESALVRLQEEKQLWHLGEPGKGEPRRNPALDQVLSVRSFGVCLTGVHHVGLLGEEGLWRAAAGCQAFISSYIRHPQQQECFHLSGWDQKARRPAGNDIGEELSRAQTLKEQLQKLQEEFYHLHWSIKDVTERALHEALKQSKLPGFSGSGRAVQEVINQVLEKLEESQVPVTDYALRSSGAAVIPECTSPSFRNRAEKVILYSLPLVDYVRSPELILEKENHLGNCWPFHGSQGHVLIKLSVPVIPRAVTMDHVSGPELHGDSMSSAPKDFAVYGVTEEKEEQFLGQFVFLAPLNPTQTFRLKNELSGFVNYILLQVLSNWGHPDYTCVYRFRVHGDPLSEEGKVPLRSDNKAP